MAPKTRRNSALLRKISTLQLRLAPLVPLPSGPSHPAFPKTLMAFHLLTEDELDSIAHYYHQSTPGPWTDRYPSNMNWDKEWLARPNPGHLVASAADAPASRRRPSQWRSGFTADLAKVVEDHQNPTGAESSDESNIEKYVRLSDRDRMRIKRRKVGKFVGLVGMETPAEEVAGRMLASLDRAIDRSREESRRNELGAFRGPKMA